MWYPVLACLQHQQVGAFFVQVGIGQVGRAIFQGVDHLVGKILANGDRGQLVGQCGGVDAQGIPGRIQLCDARVDSGCTGGQCALSPQATGCRGQLRRLRQHRQRSAWSRRSRQR
jgi:hypothetical protein